ncbi:MAG TPA: hypothetical protein VH442_10160 [Micromonosporaceae bacterium]
MLTRRARVRAWTVAGVVTAVIVALGSPAVATTGTSVLPSTALPASSAAVSALPDTSLAAATPVRNATLTAAPNPAALPGPPVQAAAAPAIVIPFLSDQNCTYNGAKLGGLSATCVDAILGAYDPLDNCFWKKLVPQPPPGDPLWGGQPSTPPAALYTVTCKTHFGPNVGNAAATLEYSASPPLNFNQPGLSALQASVLNAFVSLLALSPIPKVETAPQASGQPGVVGLPIWMWSDIPPLLWDPKSISIKIPFLGTFGGSFLGQQVDWDMGDGEHVFCSTPGSAYLAAKSPPYKLYTGPPGPSPDCGYTYDIAGTFPVSATVTWYIGFQISGTTGTFVLSRTTPAMMLKIGEAQVVTQ